MNNNEINSIMDKLNEIGADKSASSVHSRYVYKFYKYTDSELQNIAVYLHPDNRLSYYHSHDFYEINYVANGSCINHIFGKNYIMKKGDMVILHPDVYHSLYSWEADSVLNILIRREYFESLKGSICGGNAFSTFLNYSDKSKYFGYLYVGGEYDEYLNDRIIALADEGFGKQDYKCLVLQSIFTEILCLIVRNQKKTFELSETDNIRHLPIIEILEYLHDNYNTATLESTAKYMGYAPAYLSRMIKKHTETNFSDYIIDIRMKRAMYFLTATKLSVSAICENVGYTSIEYFYRLFKKHTGLTPNEYRHRS